MPEPPADWARRSVAELIARLAEMLARGVKLF